MKGSLIAGACALLMTVGCQSNGQYIDNHWNESSTSPRVARFFLGYDASRDGAYRDFAWKNKQDINMVLRRYFFNHNPDNPNHKDVASRYEPRPRNSPLPNPVNFFHLTLGIDSMIGVFEEGGVDEFVEGFEEFLGPVAVITDSLFDVWVRELVFGTKDEVDDEG